MADLEAENNDGEFDIANKENSKEIRKKKEKRTEKGGNKRKANQEMEKTNQRNVKKRTKPPINFSITDLETENDDEEFDFEKLPIE